MCKDLVSEDEGEALITGRVGAWALQVNLQRKCRLKITTALLKTPSHSYSEPRSDFPWAQWRIIKHNFYNFPENLQAKEETRLGTCTFPIRAGSELLAASVGVPSLSKAKWGLIVGMGPPVSHLVWRRWHFLNPRTLIRSNKGGRDPPWTPTRCSRSLKGVVSCSQLAICVPELKWQSLKPSEKRQVLKLADPGGT